MDREIACEKATALLASFEGFCAKAYPDRNQNDASVVWTIGYGQTQLNEKSVQQGDVISPKDAMDYLRDEVDNLASLVFDWSDNNGVSLTENQLASLISISYNIGYTAFTKSSLATDIISHKKDNIGIDFEKFDKIRVGGTLVYSKGLFVRRQKEYDVFVA